MQENKQIISALVKAQAEIETVGMSGTNPMYKSKFFTLNDVLNAIKEPKKNNGLATRHSVEFKDGHFFLKTILSHISGEEMEITFPMVMEKTNNQGMASACTYAQRRSLCSLFAISSDIDDDANAADNVSHEIQATQNDFSQFSPTDEPNRMSLISEINRLIDGKENTKKYILDSNSKYHKKQFNSFSEMDTPILENVISFLKTPPKTQRRSPNAGI